MKPIEIITVFTVLASLLLGIYNLLISIRGQRKFQRELIFSKQFDFYMKTQDLLTDFEDAIDCLNDSNEDLEASQDIIFNLASKLDKHITKHEIIIPEALYFKLNDYAMYCHKLSGLASTEPMKINTALENELLDKNIELVDCIRQLIGVEHLSEENRKLVRGRLN